MDRVYGGDIKDDATTNVLIRPTWVFKGSVIVVIGVRRAKKVKNNRSRNSYFRDLVTCACFAVENELIRILFVYYVQSFREWKPTIGVPMYGNSIDVF